ncbi:MAG: hypothetical protein PHV17_08310 [Candidatus Omnitrophica bacterium]|nr:hypothetical protein [Candidatus Omnitrophota bacterium]
MGAMVVLSTIFICVVGPSFAIAKIWSGTFKIVEQDKPLKFLWFALGGTLLCVMLGGAALYVIYLLFRV